MKKGFTEKNLNFLEKRKRIFLILLIGLNILSFLGLLRIKINSDFNLFMPQNSVQVENFNDMSEKFGSSEQIMVMVELPSKPDNLENLNKIISIQKSLKLIPEIKSSMGPVPEKVPSGFRQIDTSKLEEKDMQTVLHFIENMGSTGSLYEKDGKYYALFSIMPDSSGNSAVTLKNVEAVFEKSGLKTYITGDIYLQTKIFEYVLRIILLLPPLALFLILFTFRLRIGSLKATFLSVLPAGLGALWTMGLLGWIGSEISLVTVITPIFTIVMGSAHGLHFMSHFLDHLEENTGKKEALRKTMQNIGKPIFLTTVTTVAGFLSLLVIGSEAMGQMSVFTSFGISFAGLATWVFLPVVCLFLKSPGKRKYLTKDKITPAIEKLQGKKSYFISLALIAAFLPGIFFIKTDFNMVSMYKEDTEVRKNLELIQNVSGGALPAFVVYDSEQDLLSSEIAEKILNIENILITQGLVTKTVSVYDLYSNFNKILYGGEKPQYPSNSIQINLVSSIISLQGAGLLDNFISKENNSGRIIIFPKDLSGQTLEKITQIFAKASDEVISFNITGIPILMKEMNDRIMPDQVKSLLLAILVIFIIMFISQRNLSVALSSIIPIGITLVSLFGFMGYTGITLNIITSTIASITIGVGVDYAIHIASLFQVFRKEYGPREASKKAFQYVSRPVLANALGLAIGLSALLLSPMVLHTYMSMLMWVSMVVSAFASLTLLPSILGRKKV